MESLLGPNPRYATRMPKFVAVQCLENHKHLIVAPQWYSLLNVQMQKTAGSTNVAKLEGSIHSKLNSEQEMRVRKR
jgi:hypothetical protein